MSLLEVASLPANSHVLTFLSCVFLCLQHPDLVEKPQDSIIISEETVTIQRGQQAERQERLQLKSMEVDVHQQDTATLQAALWKRFPKAEVETVRIGKNNVVCKVNCFT